MTQDCIDPALELLLDEACGGIRGKIDAVQRRTRGHREACQSELGEGIMQLRRGVLDALRGELQGDPNAKILERLNREVERLVQAHIQTKNEALRQLGRRDEDAMNELWRTTAEPVRPALEAARSLGYREAATSSQMDANQPPVPGRCAVTILKTDDGARENSAGAGSSRTASPRPDSTVRP